MQNANSRRVYKTAEQMEQEPGIKAQHAVFRALERLLAQAKSGWTVTESAVGSVDDRNGVDIRLISPDKRTNRLLDVSLGDKPGKEGFLVRVYYDWFDVKEDGTWELLKEREQDLIRRAILPTMSAPSVGVSYR